MIHKCTMNNVKFGAARKGSLNFLVEDAPSVAIIRRWKRRPLAHRQFTPHPVAAPLPPRQHSQSA